MSVYQEIRNAVHQAIELEGVLIIIEATSVDELDDRIGLLEELCGACNIWYKPIKQKNGPLDYDVGKRGSIIRFRAVRARKARRRKKP